MSLSEAVEVIKKLPPGFSSEKGAHLISQTSKIILLKTSWYPELIESLEKSAKDYLLGLGFSLSQIEVKQIPGSFELPLAAEAYCRRSDVGFVVALGCILRGDTPHFEFVSRAAVDGLMRVQLDFQKPVGLGVLTVDNMSQAEKRKDKGAEAAQAAFWMYYLLEGMRR